MISEALRRDQSFQRAMHFHKIINLGILEVAYQPKEKYLKERLWKHKRVNILERD